MLKSSDFVTRKNEVTEQSLHEWRSRALSIFLIVVAITSLPAYASVIINAIQNYQMTWREYIYLVVYAGSAALAFFPKLDLKYKSWGIMALSYTNAIVSFMRLGLAGSGRLWLIVMPIIAIIAISAKAGYFAAVFSILIYVSFSILVNMGFLENWIVLQENPTTLGYWLEGGAALLVFIATSVILVERFSDLQQRSFREAQQSNIHLTKTTQALLESEARFRLFMDHFPGLAYIKDSNTRVLFANRGFFDYLQIDNSQIIGKENADIFPSEFAEIITADDQLVLESFENQEFEENFAGRNWTTYKFIIPQEDQPPMLGGLTLDITERKIAEEKIHRLNEELEQRVSERTRQLESANKEMEAFAYSVSHDLRAPLRAINGFINILIEDYAHHLDPEGREICHTIDEETKRMNQLIDDLLVLSRLTRVDMQNIPIDMYALARAVFLDLSASAKSHPIEFHLDEIPPAIGDPGLLRQVWTNLFDNAIKFTSKKEQAKIWVCGKQEAGEIIYTVRDNGAGFEMQYVDRLFNVFQRLHSGKEFKGTGVGLAIVQRIIMQHGGRVWAEGTVENGAVFYFTLPRIKV
ncbi:MAG: PAS domain-containing protein [Anaerolineales bacterium]|nr:PAS domain-containing protein [Anaerolineales bacterium]